MPTPEQSRAIENSTRKSIYEFLQSYDKPASLGEIDEGIDLGDIARTHYHLNQLVEVGLVEKVPGANTYRVVEG
jgi:hypothetical protein